MSRLRHILQTNKYSFSSREFGSLSDMILQLRSRKKQKFYPKDVSGIIDKRPISLCFRVSSLIELSELDKAAEVSRLAVLDMYCGLNSENIIIRNEIIGALCAAKKYDHAIDLHYFFRRKSKITNSAISFNHIIKAHCDENRVDYALMLSNPDRSCLVEDVSVDTLRLLTKVLVDKGRIYEAMGLIKYIRVSDSVVYSYLIRGFLDQGNHDKAYDLFDELLNNMSGGHKGRSVLDATFVDYWFKQGEDAKAMEVYRSLISRKVMLCASTGNTLLEILFDNGKETEAWDLFNAMLTNSFNRDTFGTVVNACFKLRHFKLALHTFKSPEFTRSSRCYANIIAQFCEHGMMSQAQDLFDELCSAPEYLSPDVPTFRSLINGYAKAGRVDDAVRILKLMVDATLLKFSVHSAH